MKKIIILGNGFDLNLGLKTSYKQFMNSNYFDKLVRKKKSYLINRIFNNYMLQNWIDLEEELKNFAIEHSNRYKSVIDVKHEFIGLTESLNDYLLNINYNDVVEDTIAGIFLKAIYQYQEDFDIYTFNYTNLNNILKLFKIKGSIHYTHVHGSVDDHSIILGFEDDVDISDDYCYMIKTFHAGYSSHNIRYALDEASEVIFFGHSLGSTDYHYFSQFFLKKSDINLKKEDAIKLTIITANEDSKIEILKQLRRMNNRQTNILYDQNDINFICCNNYNAYYQIHDLINRLKIEYETNRIILE